MEIGKPSRAYTVEPLEHPVPRELPAEPEEQQLPEPAEPELAPAE